MKPSELLAEARKLIESGDSNYVCNAVRQTTRDKYVPEKTYIDVERHIDKSLMEMQTYDDLLFTRQRDDYEKMTSEDIRKSRLAWIDDMIREFQKVGK